MNDYVVYDAGDSDSDAPNGDENGGEDSGENGGGQAAAQVAIVLPSDGLNLRAGANTASGRHHGAAAGHDADRHRRNAR